MVNGEGIVGRRLVGGIVDRRGWIVPRGTFWKLGSKREMFHVEQLRIIPRLGPDSKRNESPKKQNSALKFTKFSTEVRICRVPSRPRDGCCEALPPHMLAPRSRAFLQGAFHRCAPFSTCQTPTLESLFPFNLECHEQDSRHSQPEGRSWQNHDGD
jgi:hypothetical protein